MKWVHSPSNVELYHINGEQAMRKRWANAAQIVSEPRANGKWNVSEYQTGYG